LRCQEFICLYVSLLQTFDNLERFLEKDCGAQSNLAALHDFSHAPELCLDEGNMEESNM
jgi:hypothetical protein